MIKIAHSNDIENQKLPQEVVKLIESVAEILDSTYGADRDVDSEDGGFVLVIESQDDFSKMKELWMDIDDIIPEYTDEIKCQNGETWINSLILMNNEFGVSLMMPIEIAPQVLLDEIC